MHKLDSSSLFAKHVPDIATVSELAVRCQEEMDRLQRGESTENSPCLQLLALAQLHNKNHNKNHNNNDDQTWYAIERCFSPVTRYWMRRHPRYEDACRIKSERRYVTLALAKFRHGVVEQGRTFASLPTALRYLLVCINCVLLDTLRSAAWFEKIQQHELLISYDATDKEKDAALLQRFLADEREQRLAYLLFHCGLKPREIAEKCPSEFADLEEVYQLRASLMERLTSSMDHGL